MRKISDTESNKINEGFEFANPVLETSYSGQIDPRVKECLLDTLKPLQHDSLITEHKEVSVADEMDNDPILTFERFIEKRNHN